MNELFDQIQLMRGDFARVDGKMADFDNKISAVQDNVSNLKSEIMRTPSQDHGALYKSPPRRQFFGSSPPRGDRSKNGGNVPRQHLLAGQTKTKIGVHPLLAHQNV